MEFNEDLQQYSYEYEGLIFVWDEEPEEDVQETVEMLCKNYKDHLHKIIEFMLPDLREMYGNVTADDVSDKLGQPIIDINNGRVSYCEQTFDSCHLFEFEFLDDEFEELQYFSIDG